MLRRRRDDSPILRARDRPEMFDAVWLAYWDTVLRFMARHTFDPEVAFDLAAETFTTMLAHIRELRGDTEAAGQAWMWSIARHQLSRWYESGSVERRYRDRLKIDVGSPGTDELERIEDLADMEPLRQRVRRALDSLEESPRRLLHLRVVEHWSYTEVATELGVTTSAARRRVARALALLNERFHETADEQP
jgi:RNA polymerase sigma factor (sigma-70 family)